MSDKLWAVAINVFMLFMCFSVTTLMVYTDSKRSDVIDLDRYSSAMLLASDTINSESVIVVSGGDLKEGIKSLQGIEAQRLLLGQSLLYAGYTITLDSSLKSYETLLTSVNTGLNYSLEYDILNKSIVIKTRS